MKSRADLIEHIKAADLCCGCGLCGTLAAEFGVSMELDGRGFLRPLNPARTLSAEARQAISDCCPGLSLKNVDSQSCYDMSWGPVRGLCLAWSADEEIRFRGSSGGAISAILIALLDAGAIDAVLQVGSSPSDPLQNEVHVSTTRQEVLANAGARYAPSAPLSGLEPILKSRKRVAIVGKPCDIAALRRFCAAQPDVQERIVLFLSFFCGGIPSLEGAKAVVEELGASHAEIKSFSFRGNGWPGKTEAVMRDGSRLSMTYEKSWGTILNRRLQLRCKICPDSTGEFADIACGDGWHLKHDGSPDFSEHPGRSLVVARTERGVSVLRSLTENGTLVIAPLNLNDLARIQPFQARKKPLVYSRVLAMRLFGLEIPRYNYSHLAKAARRAGFGANLRSFSGMAVRALRIRRRRHVGRGKGR